MGSTRARIAVDAMGGDNAPAAIVAGALKARQESDVEVILVGDPEQIRACLKQGLPEGVTIAEASQAIAMDDDPIASIRKKPKSSINIAMKLVKEGQADAVVSAGHSGAIMAAAQLKLRRLPGIDRAAIGAVLPTVDPHKQVLILDVGANVDCRPSFLEQFAVMGAAYSQWVMGVENPKVGLLNIGEEDCKGNDLALKTYPLLQANRDINFIGNAEGRDVLSGDFDVVVCDGFAGNVLLKFAEAVGSVLLAILKEEIPRGIRGKAGAMVLKPNLKRIKQRVDHAEHGGGLLLGVAGVCIISHGSSGPDSIASAVRLAKDAVDNRVLEHIARPGEQAAAERAPMVALAESLAESEAVVEAQPKVTGSPAG
jgi:phosphate acyltransferase